MRSFWGLLSETFNEWLEDKAPRLGAALAYYAAFSIAPLLVLLVAIVGFLYKEDSLPRIQGQIATIAGYNAADAIVATIQGVKNTGGSVSATILSIITLLLGATGMFGQLQDAMNTMTLRRIRHLPVVSDGRVAGLVSLGDVVNALREEREVEVRYLKDYLASPY